MINKFFFYAYLAFLSLINFVFSIKNEKLFSNLKTIIVIDIFLKQNLDLSFLLITSIIFP